MLGGPVGGAVGSMLGGVLGGSGSSDVQQAEAGMAVMFQTFMQGMVQQNMGTIQETMQDIQNQMGSNS
jgi:hypothetical protein